MKRHYLNHFPLLLLVTIPSGWAWAETTEVDNSHIKIEFLGQPGILWRYTAKEPGQSFDLAPPRFEIDGRVVVASLTDVRESADSKILPNGVQEYRFAGRLEGLPVVSLEGVLRVAAESAPLPGHLPICHAESCRQAMVGQRRES